jgi:multidrug resistance protein MdtO
MIFITRIALLKYRLGLSGFELPETVHAAQQGFDETLAQLLDGMADRVEGKTPQEKSLVEHLEKWTQGLTQEEADAKSSAQIQTFLSLSRSIENLTVSLDKEI